MSSSSNIVSLARGSGRGARRARTLLTMAFFGALCMVPATGFAQSLAISGAGLEGTRLFWATGLALLIVSITGVGGGMLFALVRRLRWMPRAQEIRLARGLRVLFGALILMAMILPYVVINFSVVALVPIVGVVGVVFAAGMLHQGVEHDREVGRSR